MKKIVLSLLLILLCAVLAACGEQSATTNTNTPAGSNNTAAADQTAAVADGPFNIRNTVTWGMTKAQVDEAETGNMMKKQEGTINDHWSVVLYYPAPITPNYLFALQYMFKDGKLAAVIYDTGSDVGETEYADIKKIMDEAYGTAASANVADVLKINDAMLPGKFTESNVIDGWQWAYGTEASIYQYKYMGERFVLLFADPAQFAE